MASAHAVAKQPHLVTNKDACAAICSVLISVLGNQTKQAVLYVA